MNKTVLIWIIVMSLLVGGVVGAETLSSININGNDYTRGTTFYQAGSKYTVDRIDSSTSMWVRTEFGNPLEIRQEQGVWRAIYPQQNTDPERISFIPTDTSKPANDWKPEESWSLPHNIIPNTVVSMEVFAHSDGRTWVRQSGSEEKPPFGFAEPKTTTTILDAPNSLGALQTIDEENQVANFEKGRYSLKYKKEIPKIYDGPGLPSTATWNEQSNSWVVNNNVRYTNDGYLIPSTIPSNVQVTKTKDGWKATKDQSTWNAAGTPLTLGGGETYKAPPPSTEVPRVGQPVTEAQLVQDKYRKIKVDGEDYYVKGGTSYKIGKDDKLVPVTDEKEKTAIRKWYTTQGETPESETGRTSEDKKAVEQKKFDKKQIDEIIKVSGLDSIKDKEEIARLRKQLEGGKPITPETSATATKRKNPSSENLPKTKKGLQIYLTAEGKPFAAANDADAIAIDSAYQGLPPAVQKKYSIGDLGTPDTKTKPGTTIYTTEDKTTITLTGDVTTVEQKKPEVDIKHPDRARSWTITTYGEEGEGNVETVTHTLSSDESRYESGANQGKPKSRYVENTKTTKTTKEESTTSTSRIVHNTDGTTSTTTTEEKKSADGKNTISTSSIREERAAPEGNAKPGTGELTSYRSVTTQPAGVPINGQTFTAPTRTTTEGVGNDRLSRTVSDYNGDPLSRSRRVGNYIIEVGMDSDGRPKDPQYFKANPDGSKASDIALSGADLTNARVPAESSQSFGDWLNANPGVEEKFSDWKDENANKYGPSQQDDNFLREKWIQDQSEGGGSRVHSQFKEAQSAGTEAITTRGDKVKKEAQRDRQRQHTRNNMLDLQASLKLFSGFSQISSWLFDDDMLASWREKIDKVFSVLSPVGLAETAICKSKFDMKKDGSSYYELPGGQFRIGATVQGEKSSNVPQPCFADANGNPTCGGQGRTCNEESGLCYKGDQLVTINMYKLYFFAQASKKDLIFNIELRPGNFQLFEKGIALKGGDKPDSYATPYIDASDANYNQICLVVIQGELDSICKTIVTADEVADKQTIIATPVPDAAAAAPTQNQAPRRMGTYT